MQQTRRLRLQAVIQEELSLVVAREVKDPRIHPVTFTSVEVTPDGSHAVIYVALFGSGQVSLGEGMISNQESKNRLKDCLAGLNSASGFLRKHLSKVLTIRHVPTLAFKEDRGFENALRVNELLKEIEPKS